MAVRTMTKERWPFIKDRIDVLLGGDYPLGPGTTLTYSWTRGYEKLTVANEGHGSSEFAGVFHPVDGLCIGNPCDYCGATFHGEAVADSQSEDAK